MIKLSVLDQSVATAGRGHDASIRDTLDLAGFCEDLGYHRFWLSEHHNHETIVGTAPEILMAAIAARTQRIRVGSAGVMLPHYSPLKVAEQFRVLEAIAPGRIDLGLGRAPGSDGKTAYALNPNAPLSAEHFPAAVRDLIAWVHGEPLIEGHPFAEIRAHPAVPTAPEVWMLGTSDFGAQLAAYLGIPYCFAHFITDGRGTERALQTYRENYRPSARHPKPQATVCLWALAADSDEAANHEFMSRGHWKVKRDQGIWTPLEPPDVAAAHERSPEEAAGIERFRNRTFVGTAKDVGARLRELAKTLDIEEIVILTWAYEPVVRRRSYMLFAEEFGLKP